MAGGSNVSVLLAMPAHLSTLETLELLVEDPRISDVFRKGLRREITRAHHARRQHQAGVCWSGMSDDPYRVKSAEAIAEEAHAEEERMRSPRGRFLAAMREMEGVDPASAEKARAEFLRNLADDRYPLNAVSVGACLAILNGVPGKAARDGIEALSELLLKEAA